MKTIIIWSICIKYPDESNNIFKIWCGNLQINYQRCPKPQKLVIKLSCSDHTLKRTVELRTLLQLNYDSATTTTSCLGTPFTQLSHVQAPWSHVQIEITQLIVFFDNDQVSSVV